MYTIFSSRFDQALGWTVLHSVWQLTLIALLAGLLLWAFQNRPAKVRYWVANGALLAVLTTVAGTFWWQLNSSDYAWREVKVELKERFAEASTDQPAAAAPVPTTNTLRVKNLVKRPPQPLQKTWQDRFDQHLPLIVLVWLLGLTLCLFRLLGGLSYVYQIKRRMNFPVDPYWIDTLQRLTNRAGFRRPIDLLESALVRSPLTVGHLKPFILFPLGLINRLSEQEVEAILAHELAHILRHDYLFNVLQHLVETLFYYHPAVWWLSVQVRNERESACDDLAIDLLGNRLGYAKALVAMQEMALVPQTPALAFAGRGKSQLLLRVQRLFSPSSFNINIMEKWIATLLVACSIVALTWGQRAQESFNGSGPATQTSTATDPNNGVWQAEFFKDSVCLNLSGGQRNNHWSFGDCYLKSVFTGLSTTPGDVNFSLTRPAGVLTFTGKLEGDQGYGKYQFVPNAAYVAELNRQGIAAKDEFLLIHLFWAGFETDYVKSMQKIGIEGIDEEKLSELAIFRIGVDEAKEYTKLANELGGDKLDADKLVELKISNVTAAQVKAYAQMGLNLDLDEVSQLSLQNVDPAFIQQMNSQGFGKLNAEELLSAKIHNITPEFVAEVRSMTLDKVNFDDVVSLKIHGVNADEVKKARALGLGELSVEDALTLKVHNIDADFVKQAQSLGLGKLSMEDVLSLKIHNIDASTVKEAQALGMSKPNLEDLVNLKVHNIDPEFARQAESLGLGKLSTEDLMTLRIHNINADFVKRSQSLGLGKLSLEDLMTLRIHNIDADFMRQFTDLGFKNLTLDDLVTARIHGVTPDFIKQAGEKGYKFPSLEEYGELKIREHIPGRRAH